MVAADANRTATKNMMIELALERMKGLSCDMMNRTCEDACKSTPGCMYQCTLYNTNCLQCPRDKHELKCAEQADKIVNFYKQSHVDYAMQPNPIIVQSAKNVCNVHYEYLNGNESVKDNRTFTLQLDSTCDWKVTSMSV